MQPTGQKEQNAPSRGMLGTPPPLGARHRNQDQKAQKSSRGLRSRAALGYRRAFGSANRKFSRRYKRFWARWARDPATSLNELQEIRTEEQNEI